MSLRAALLACAVLFLAGAVRAGDWPGWRGPTGQGISDEKDLPLTWNAKSGENVLWKTPLPGQEAKLKQDQNQSSPIVVKGKVFVTASYWPAGAQPGKDYPEHHVVCYNAAGGTQVWDTKVEPGPWKLTDLRGGYTVATPACDGARVYVVFGSSVIVALDCDGRLVWRKEIVPFKFDVCFGSSPVIYRDTVILQCDGVKGTSRLVAYDGKTGEARWTQKRSQGFTHSTPTLARIGAQDQLLTAATDAVEGIDPADGNVLWSCAGKGDTVSPVFGAGVVYCDSGRGGAGLAVDPTGAGDVSKTHVKWRLNHVGEGFSSPVIVGELLYRMHNPGILKCWTLATGEQVFSGRLEKVSTSPSPITTPDGRIWLASAGRTYVVKAGPKLDVLAVNDLGDESNASAAIAGGCIFLRGRQYLYCIGKK